MQKRSTYFEYIYKNKSNENFKTSISSKNYDRPKATTECGILKKIG